MAKKAKRRSLALIFFTQKEQRLEIGTAFWLIEASTQSERCFRYFFVLISVSEKRGEFLFIYLLIWLSSRMTSLLLCQYSSAPCSSTSKGGISTGAMSSLVVILVYWPIGRPKSASSCYSGGMPLTLYSLNRCIKSIVNEKEVVDCTIELTFHGSSNLLSVNELAFLAS